MSRQLVELEREISLTTPLIADLDQRLTGGQSSGMTTEQSGMTTIGQSGMTGDQSGMATAKQPAVSLTPEPPTSAVELTVKTAESEMAISADVTSVEEPPSVGDKLTSAMDSGTTDDVPAVDKLTTALDSGLQMASPASSGQSYQVRRKGVKKTLKVACSSQW